MGKKIKRRRLKKKILLNFLGNKLRNYWILNQEMNKLMINREKWGRRNIWVRKN
jgi:hypothetical protein